MSAKARRGGRPDRTSMNRQNSNKGRGFSSKTNYVQANKVRHQDTATYDHYNQYFADSVVRMVGCSVQVTTVDGFVYDGILETISPKCEVCLRSAHLQADLNKPKVEQFMNPTNENIKNIRFEFRNVDSIKCKNVDWDFPEKDSFHTDTMISGSNGPISTERELKPWTSDTDGTNIGNLEEITEISNGDTYTDLKRTNEEKFQFQSSFNESVMDTYMDGIETHDPQLHRERSEKAARIAREMEQKDSYRVHEKLDSGFSEDEKYSSVQRPGNPHTSQPRNSGSFGRGRGGRARGSNFQGGSEGFDLPFNGRPPKYGGSSVKRSEPGEQSNSRLYSDFFKSQPGNQQQQQPPQQQQNASYHQTSRQEPFRQPDDNKLPPAVQLEAQERPMGGQLPQGMSTSYQDSIPPRMQQKHNHHLASSSRLQSAQKPHIPPQRDPLSTQSDVVDDERKLKSIDSVNSFGASASGSSDKKARFTPVQQKPALSDYSAKTAVEGTRSKIEPPRSKFGKIRHEEETRRQTDIGDLKKFGSQFTLGTPASKQMMKPRDALVQETAEANGEVAQVTSELPLKASSGPGDLKTATTLHKVQDLRLDEKEGNEKGHSKTEGNQAEPAVASGEAQAVSTPTRTNNPGDAPLIGSKDTSVSDGENVVIQLSPEPKSFEKNPSEKALNKVAEEKKPSNAKEPATFPEQKQTTIGKTKLNPNAGVFVPRSTMPSPASSSSQHPTVSAPPQPPIAVTSFQSNVPGQQIPVYHPRARANPHQSTYAVSDASPHVYQGYLPQGVQSQQHSQPPVVQYILLPQGAGNPGFGNQSQFMRPIHNQGYPQPQIVSPFVHEQQNLYVMQAGNQMLHQQQQQAPLHQHGAIHSHPSTPSQPSPMHFVVHSGNPQYPQIASPMQSNPQGTPGPHPRPPTPSQHPIHPSATPPLHPVGGQQTLYYPQGPVQNVPPQPFVATQRPQHISPFQ